MAAARRGNRLSPGGACRGNDALCRAEPRPAEESGPQPPAPPQRRRRRRRRRPPPGPCPAPATHLRGPGKTAVRREERDRAPLHSECRRHPGPPLYGPRRRAARPGGGGAGRQGASPRHPAAQPRPGPGQPAAPPSPRPGPLGPSSRVSSLSTFLECLKRGLTAAALVILSLVGKRKRGMKQAGTCFSRDFYFVYECAQYCAHTLEKVKSKECFPLSW